MTPKSFCQKYPTTPKLFYRIHLLTPFFTVTCSRFTPEAAMWHFVGIRMGRYTIVGENAICPNITEFNTGQHQSNQFKNARLYGR